MPMVRHFANGFATVAARSASLILTLRLRTLPASSVIASVESLDDLHGGHRLVEDPSGVVQNLEARESLSLQLAYVVLLCPAADLATLVLRRRTCRDKIGLGARVAALMGVIQMLGGLGRRVVLLGIRRVPANGLESAQEDLEGLRQDLYFGQEEALATLHGPKHARLGGGVAIVGVFAIIAVLFVVRATRESKKVFQKKKEKNNQKRNVERRSKKKCKTKVKKSFKSLKKKSGKSLKNNQKKLKKLKKKQKMFLKSVWKTKKKQKFKVKKNVKL